MIKICFLGILIGTFALMLTLIITNGFEETIHEKMQGINANVLVTCPGHRLDYQELRNTLLREYSPYISNITGSMIKQAILDHHDTQTVLFLKGVDPVNESNVTVLPQKILFPPSTPSQERQLTHLFSSHNNSNNILVGYKTAQSLHLHLGDSVTILIPEPTSRKKIFLHKKIVTIAGIFRIGLEEYDSNFAFCSLDFLHEAFDERGVDTVSIKLAPNKQFYLSGQDIFKNQPWTKSFWKYLGLYFYQKIILLYTPDLFEQQVLHTLSLRLPHLSVHSWKDLYPALVSSLKLEKYVMFFILALITLVASMNMISLLFMQIQQKQKDIAIFKAMGVADNNISKIFLLLGLFITLTASLCGLGLAAIAGYLLEKYPFIQLPDVYYVSHLPARMNGEIFIIVFIATFLLGFIATWIPAHRCRKILVAHVLRQ
jgi:lipoprotein-releasing system permease protein